VNTNPKNPVIGVRAFGDNVKLVSDMGAAFIRGQQEANIATVAKHFPGHGSVDSDSHAALPVAFGSEQQLRHQLKPFEVATQAGLDGMMTAHVALPALTGDETPATLSPKVLDTVLRKQLHFEGLVLTDELEMDAIDQRYGVGRAAVMAINAGADMVLVPWRKEKKTEVYEALLQAARSQEISTERLNQAVERVIQLKAKRKLFAPIPPLAQRLAELGKERGVEDDIARAALTLLKDSPGLLPLNSSQRTVVVTAEKVLAETLSKSVTVSAVLTVPAFPKDGQREALKRSVAALSERADVALVTVHNSRHLDLVVNAKLKAKKVIAVILGLPYLAAMVPEADVVMVAYSYRAASLRAVADMLAGRLEPVGKLPVQLQRMPFGFGLHPKSAAVAPENAEAVVNRPLTLKTHGSK
jgi:beta-N-acetylhexosaminidase